jgi:hypothetical protein
MIGTGLIATPRPSAGWLQSLRPSTSYLSQWDPLLKHSDGVYRRLVGGFRGGNDTAAADV